MYDIIVLAFQTDNDPRGDVQHRQTKGTAPAVPEIGVKTGPAIRSRTTMRIRS